MSFYRRFLYPRLVDAAMRQREMTARRAALVPRARGRVLEIGIGSGLNLPFYGPEVSAVVGVDTSPELLARARARSGSLAVPLTLHEAPAERLPLDAASVDTVVVTWTLCSIPDPGAALGEARRVLRPSGRLLFVEHGLAPEEDVARWQRRIEPLWVKVSGGCHLTRKADDLVEAAGLEVTELVTGYLPGPRLLAWGGYTYQGEARGL